MEKLDFEKLFADLRAGDERAAAELVRRYEPYLRQVVRVRLTNPHLRRVFDSLDVCQSVLGEFFVRMADGRFQFQDPDRLRAVGDDGPQQARRPARHERRHSGGLPQNFDTPARALGPEELTLQRELAHAIRDRLSDRESWLVDQRLQGRSWIEIAAHDGGQPAALRMMYARALRGFAGSFRENLAMPHEMPLGSRQQNGAMLTRGDSAPVLGDPIFEALLDEHRVRWQEGEPIGAADYLAQNPIFQADSYKAASLIYQEFVLREQRGELVSFSEYVTDFSQYATDLRLLHDADRILMQLLVDPPEPVGVGHLLGEYELLDEIGRGGMGIVYRARQEGLDRLVALKTLSAGALASAVDIERFCNEAPWVAQLQHPNIVAVHAAGVHEGRHFFTMDLVEGQSLAAMVRDGPLSPVRAASYVRTVAKAIHHAHEHGILHRDLKPSNILIDGSDQPRITDFGLAHSLAADSKLTLTGQVLGTPGYMPPEQASGKNGRLSAATDVYALGAIRL